VNNTKEAGAKAPASSAKKPLTGLIFTLLFALTALFLATRIIQPLMLWGAYGYLFRSIQQLTRLPDKLAGGLTFLLSSFLLLYVVPYVLKVLLLPTWAESLAQSKLGKWFSKWFGDNGRTHRLFALCAIGSLLMATAYFLVQPREGEFFDPFDGKPMWKYSETKEQGIKLYHLGFEYEPLDGSRLKLIDAETARRYREQEKVRKSALAPAPATESVVNTNEKTPSAQTPPPATPSPADAEKPPIQTTPAQPPPAAAPPAEITNTDPSLHHCGGKHSFQWELDKCDLDSAFEKGFWAGAKQALLISQKILFINGQGIFAFALWALLVASLMPTVGGWIWKMAILVSFSALFVEITGYAGLVILSGWGAMEPVDPKGFWGKLTLIILSVVYHTALGKKKAIQAGGSNFVHDNVIQEGAPYIEIKEMQICDIDSLVLRITFARNITETGQKPKAGELVPIKWPEIGEIRLVHIAGKRGEEKKERPYFLDCAEGVPEDVCVHPTRQSWIIGKDYEDKEAPTSYQRDLTLRFRVPSELANFPWGKQLRLDFGNIASVDFKI